MTYPLVNMALIVGMAGGLAFGNIAVELLNLRDRRRARRAWEKAWRATR